MFEAGKVGFINKVKAWRWTSLVETCPNEW